MKPKTEMANTETVDSAQVAVGPTAAAVLAAVLADVLRYRRGLGRYNFSRLSEEDRGIAAMEAWEELEKRIATELWKAGVSQLTHGI